MRPPEQIVKQVDQVIKRLYYLAVSRSVTPSVSTLEAQKRASTLQLLFKCARRANEIAVARLSRSPGGGGLRTSHTLLLPHIDFEGTRLTEVARRVGISKQATGQLVDDLVDVGTLERVPDPSDGRAKLVRFTPKGKRQILQGLATLAELRDELSGLVGDGVMVALHDALSVLEGALDGGQVE